MADLHTIVIKRFGDLQLPAYEDNISSRPPADPTLLMLNGALVVTEAMTLPVVKFVLDIGA